jgi:hypothetical protein
MSILYTQNHLMSTNCSIESTPTLAHLPCAKPGKGVGCSANNVFHTVRLGVAVHVYIIYPKPFNVKPDM